MPTLIKTETKEINVLKVMEKGRNVTVKDKMCYRNIDGTRKGLATEIQGGNHFAVLRYLAGPTVSGDNLVFWLKKTYVLILRKLEHSEG